MPQPNSPAAARPRIAVDAMGGDFGPEIVIPGAVRAARERDLALVLVGDEAKVKAALARIPGQELDGLRIEVVHAAEVAEMHDKPSDVVRRKKDASIAVACRLVREGRADGVVSAGNSGATLACGMFIVGRLDGVERAAFASVMPTEKRPMVLLDVGANVDVRPLHLFQFGIMADVLARTVLGIARPRVGLLSIGEEEGKGNEQVREAYDLLRQSSLNFIGNVEGRDIFTGNVDVVVCDGFVGNVCLKLSEGLAKSIGRMLKAELLRDWVSRLGTLLTMGALKRFRRLTDYAEYGGAPLLGLKGIVIVCHGASSERAIQRAVEMAATFIESKAGEQLAAGIVQNQDLTRFTSSISVKSEQQA